MPIKLRWVGPFNLVDGAKEHLIYTIPNKGTIPEGPGVYVFSRLYGDNVVEPLYIGKAKNVRDRIPQHLTKNVKLMTRIKNIPLNGSRVLHVGVLEDHQGMPTESAIRIAERALISAAIIKGYELLNLQGTKTPVYTIEGSGRKDARRWWPDINTLEVPK
ncbi:MAG: GIY-YIG nuclease family protein [Gammaproteobacteria bacterium]|nr:GIY-YIG nuclease family protein [Gammaproteobacteria bacterium]